MKLNMSLSALFALVLGACAPATSVDVDPDLDAEGSALFGDVGGHDLAPYINDLAGRGVLAGSGGQFRPHDTVTRAELAAMISAILDPVGVRNTISFSDVRSSDWFSDAVGHAYRGGYMSGYPDGTFRPRQLASRGEVLVALASGLQLRREDEPESQPYDAAYVRGHLADAHEVPGWAIPHVAAAIDASMVIEHPFLQRLGFQHAATRAWTAAMFYRAAVASGRITHDGIRTALIAPVQTRIIAVSSTVNAEPEARRRRCQATYNNDTGDWVVLNVSSVLEPNTTNRYRNLIIPVPPGGSYNARSGISGGPEDFDAVVFRNGTGVKYGGQPCIRENLDTAATAAQFSRAHRFSRNFFASHPQP